MTTTGFELILPVLRPIQHLILDSEISEIMVNDQTTDEPGNAMGLPQNQLPTTVDSCRVGGLSGKRTTLDSSSKSWGLRTRIGKDGATTLRIPVILGLARSPGAALGDERHAAKPTLRLGRAGVAVQKKGKIL